MSKLVCIVPIFNFSNSEIIEHNHYLAIKYLKESGVDVFSVRAYAGTTFVDDFAVKTNSILWQKESLINYAVNVLGKDYDYIAWVDSGIYLSPGWSSKVKKSLEDYDLTQCYNGGVWLDKNLKKEGERVGYVYNHFELGGCRLKPKASVGGAWAARSSVFEVISLYDKSVVGGGDTWVINGFLGVDTPEALITRSLTPMYRQDVDNWISQARSLQLRIGYIEGKYYHMWHTSPQKRNHFHRHKILTKEGYHPERHTATNGKLLEWTNEAPPGMVRKVERFLKKRVST